MANRQALEGAIKAADARFDRLAPLMDSYQADRLLDDGGKWSVRDCLAHVAASARISGAGQRALQRVRGEAPAPTPPQPGAPSMDERNLQQSTDRTDKPIQAIVDETKAAHAAAWEDVRTMSDADLDTKVPDAANGRPAPSVGGLILRSLESHEMRQLDHIEDALKARTRWL